MNTPSDEELLAAYQSGAPSGLTRPWTSGLRAVLAKFGAPSTPAQPAKLTAVQKNAIVKRVIGCRYPTQREALHAAVQLAEEALIQPSPGSVSATPK